MSQGLLALSSEAQPTRNYGLHQRSLSDSCRQCASGFSLIEVILVVLITGILCATGVSIYAGVTGSSQERTRQDELSSFFYACRHRAIMRKTPVFIRYSMDHLRIDQSQTLKLRVADLDKKIGKDLIDGMIVNEKGQFIKDGKQLKNLTLPFLMAGNRIMTINVEL